MLFVKAFIVMNLFFFNSAVQNPLGTVQGLRLHSSLNHIGNMNVCNCVTVVMGTTTKIKTFPVAKVAALGAKA